MRTARLLRTAVLLGAASRGAGDDDEWVRLAALGDGARARERIGGVRAERGARREERARVLDRPQRAQPRDEARDVRRQAITEGDKKSELPVFTWLCYGG